jgi:hypothetical protein
MRLRHLGPLLVLLAGCSTAPRGTGLLTAEKAGALAQLLANNHAQLLYDCQPFHNASPARFVEGRWTWHRLQAQGQGDMEATVEFGPDGSEPKVKVTRLDSRHIMLQR